MVRKYVETAAEVERQADRQTDRGSMIPAIFNIYYSIARIRLRILANTKNGAWKNTSID